MNFLRIMVIAAFAAVTLSSGTATATEWTLDKERSKLSFTVTTPQIVIDAHFKSYEAELSLDPSELAKAKIVVDIDVTSVESGSTRQSGDLKVAIASPVWMSAAKFPRAIFTSTAIRHVNGNAFEMDGALKLRGVEKTVKIPFTLDLVGRTAHAVGAVELTRTDFGIGQGPFASADMVDPAVKVAFELFATRDHQAVEAAPRDRQPVKTEPRERRPVEVAPRERLDVWFSAP